MVDALVISETIRAQWAVAARGFVASFIPFTCVGFFVEFAEERSQFAQNAYRVAIATSMGLVASTVVEWPEPLVWRHGLSLVSIVLAIVVATVILIRRYRAVESPVDRARLKVLIIAGLAVFTVALVSYLPTVNSPSVGNILLAIYMFFMFEIITLRRLIDVFECFWTFS